MGTLELRNKWKEAIINVDDRFLRMIDALHESYKKEDDFFDEISPQIQELLKESREEIKNGKFSTHKEVMNRVKEKYNIS